MQTKYSTVWYADPAVRSYSEHSHHTPDLPLLEFPSFHYLRPLGLG
jgi:hypothetical protein